MQILLVKLFTVIIFVSMKMIKKKDILFLRSRLKIAECVEIIFMELFYYLDIINTLGPGDAYMHC